MHGKRERGEEEEKKREEGGWKEGRKIKIKKSVGPQNRNCVNYFGSNALYIFSDV